MAVLLFYPHSLNIKHVENCSILVHNRKNALFEICPYHDKMVQRDGIGEPPVRLSTRFPGKPVSIGPAVSTRPNKSSHF